MSPDWPPDSGPRPRRPVGVTGLIISARRRVAFFADGLFFADDFFFAADFPFATSFFGAAFLIVFFLAEAAFLAADFFRVGFFLLAVFFLRAVFFLAMEKVYQNVDGGSDICTFSILSFLCVTQPALSDRRESNGCPLWLESLVFQS